MTPELESPSCAPIVHTKGYEVVHSRSPEFYDLYECKSDLKHQTHYCARVAATG